jgi:hypothetical protein
MSLSSDPIQVIREILGTATEWHPILARSCQELLEKGIIDWKTVDDNLTIVTKEVEKQFKVMLKARTGNEYNPPSASYLVDEAVSQNIFKKESADWLDFKKYFKEPRNPFHHDSPFYSVREITEFLTITDRLLRRIDELSAKGTISAQYYQEPHPTGNAMIYGVKLTPAPKEARVEMTIGSRSRHKNILLSQIGTDLFEGKVFNHEWKKLGAAPSLSAVVQVTDYQGFSEPSGTFVSFFPLGSPSPTLRQCPQCGVFVSPVSLACPHCGKQLGP